MSLSKRVKVQAEKKNKYVRYNQSPKGIERKQRYFAKKKLEKEAEKQAALAALAAKEAALVAGSIDSLEFQDEKEENEKADADEQEFQTWLADMLGIKLKQEDGTFKPITRDVAREIWRSQRDQ